MFHEADGQAGERAQRVVVLTERFWRRHFGARPEAVGQTLQLNGEPYTVIGVLPRRYFATGPAVRQQAGSQAATRLGILVRPYRATSVPALNDALAAIAADGINGLVNFQGGLSYVNRQPIVDFAAKHRLPAIYQATVFARAGGLMTWAPNLVDQFRAAAGYVAQILKGARPGDLPVRHPARYYLTLNNTAAKNLGLSFPPTLVSQADRILP